jgi:CcmD family protein
MKLFKKYLGLFILMLLTVPCFSQETAGNENSFMYQNGKIFVVLAVVVVIVIGLFIYLFSLDRKITRLEKKK